MVLEAAFQIISVASVKGSALRHAFENVGVVHSRKLASEPVELKIEKITSRANGWNWHLIMAHHSKNLSIGWPALRSSDPVACSALLRSNPERVRAKKTLATLEGLPSVARTRWYVRPSYAHGYGGHHPRSYPERVRAKDGGGGGNRTRVLDRLPKSDYMLSQTLVSPRC